MTNSSGVTPLSDLLFLFLFPNSPKRCPWCCANWTVFVRKPSNCTVPMYGTVNFKHSSLHEIVMCISKWSNRNIYPCLAVFILVISYIWIKVKDLLEEEFASHLNLFCMNVKCMTGQIWMMASHFVGLDRI